MEKFGKFELIPIEKIIVPKRLRKNLGNIENLKKSIELMRTEKASDYVRYLKRIISEMKWKPESGEDFDWCFAEYIAKREKLDPYNAILKTAKLLCIELPNVDEVYLELSRLRVIWQREYSPSFLVHEINRSLEQGQYFRLGDVEFHHYGNTFDPLKAAYLTIALFSRCRTLPYFAITMERPLQYVLIACLFFDKPEFCPFCVEPCECTGPFSWVHTVPRKRSVLPANAELPKRSLALSFARKESEEQALCEAVAKALAGRGWTIIKCDPLSSGPDIIAHRNGKKLIAECESKFSKAAIKAGIEQIIKYKGEAHPNFCALILPKPHSYDSTVKKMFGALGVLNVLLIVVGNEVVLPKKLL